MAGVKRQLELGVSPNITDEHGTTPLMYAAGQGFSGVVDALLAAGADTEMKDAAGRTAIDQAKPGHWDDYKEGRLGAVDRLINAALAERKRKRSESPSS